MPIRLARAEPQSVQDRGRTWWAHFEFTRIDTTPTILPKKIEELMDMLDIGEEHFLMLGRR